MTSDQGPNLNCPNCGAHYRLVRVEASSATIARQLACLKCGGPLQGREGRYVLKYFLLDASRGLAKRRVG